MLDPMQPARILLVDDNLESAELLQMLLEIDGYESRIASNGVDGLEVARSFLPHLVITDIMMPQMGGKEFARRLRLEQGSRKMAIFSVSGWKDPADMGDVAGLFDFELSKPIDFDMLRNRIHDYVRSGGTAVDPVPSPAP
jgi:DNA-binding response OmpR family regulator